MAQVNVYGWTNGVAYGLGPGNTDSWVGWGQMAEYGRVVTIAAHALGRDGQPEAIMEVVDVQHEVGGDGGQRIYYTVKNNSTRDVFYAVFYAYTDVIQ